VTALLDAIVAKSNSGATIIKIGRTHNSGFHSAYMGPECSGYAGMLSQSCVRSEAGL